MLAAHFGYGEAKLPPEGCLCGVGRPFRIEEQKSTVATATADRDPARTRLQPLPGCSSGPGTRSDHELDLGMKNFMVLKLPQAFAYF